MTTAAQRHEHYERHKEEIIAKAKARYELKKEEIKRKNRERDLRDPEHTRELRKRSRHNCAERTRAEARRYRENGGDRVKGIQKASYYKDLQRRLYGNAKQRAKRLDVVFELAVSDIIVPDACPVLGVPFVWGEGLHDYSPSLDRKRPELGYTKENVAVISNLANRIKTNATAEQVKKVHEYLLTIDA